jgi:hypothetical protein
MRLRAGDTVPIAISRLQLRPRRPSPAAKKSFIITGCANRAVAGGLPLSTSRPEGLGGNEGGILKVRSNSRFSALADEDEPGNRILDDLALRRGDG